MDIHDRWTIRNATEGDISSVLDMWVAADSVPTVTDSRDGLARLLRADPTALLVAEHAGVVVGSLIAAWDGWRASFYRLAVSPEHRRKGLATMLLREGERRLRERARSGSPRSSPTITRARWASGAPPAMSASGTGLGSCATSMRSASILVPCRKL